MLVFRICFSILIPHHVLTQDHKLKIQETCKLIYFHKNMEYFKDSASVTLIYIVEVDLLYYIIFKKYCLSKYGLLSLWLQISMETSHSLYYWKITKLIFLKISSWHRQGLKSEECNVLAAILPLYYIKITIYLISHESVFYCIIWNINTNL